MSNPSEGTGGGLIDAPSGLLQTMRGGRATALVVTLLFTTLCLGTGLVDTLMPVPKPKLVGAEERLDQRKRATAQVRDGSAARLLEYDLRLTSRVRRTVLDPYAMSLYHLFDEAGNDVVVGDDDWLFLRDRIYPPPEFSRATLEEAARGFAAARRRLAGFGVELLAMPVPRKAVVSRRHLPQGIDPQPWIEKELVQILRSYGVRTFDLLELYDSHDTELFFPSDSHWTEEAERLTAEAISQDLETWVPEKRRSSRITAVEPEPTERKTFYFFGVVPSSPELAYLDERTFPAYELRDRRGKKRFQFPNPKTGSRLALVGTSFSARRDFPHFVAHYSDTPVWNMALPGAMPMDRLGYVMRVLASTPPEEIELETLIFEYPLHLIVGGAGLKDAHKVFGEAAPAHDISVAPLRGQSLGKLVPLGGRALLVSVAKGRILHDGLGSIAIELSGRSKDQDLVVDVLVGSHAYRSAWPKDQERVVLPLLHPGPTSEMVRIFLRGQGRIQVDQARLLLEAKSDLRQDLTCRPLELPDEHSWSQIIGWRGRLDVPYEGRLHIALRNAEARSVGVRIETTRGEVREQAPCPIADQATLTVDLQSLLGQRLKSIRIFGAGQPGGAGGTQGTCGCLASLSWKESALRQAAGEPPSDLGAP